MNNIQSNLDRFTHELTILRQSLLAWHDELVVKETQVLKGQEEIRRQRAELIQKSNLIVEQVNGLRGQKDQAAQKMLEAEKLKKSAITQLEEAENVRVEMSLKENELELREKNIKLLDEREKHLKQEKEQVEGEKIGLLKSQTLLKTEQRLLDEKQQVLVLREQKLGIIEAKQKRIMGDL